MDCHAIGALIQILKLMAQADGYIAGEELFVLEKISRSYLKTAKVSSWSEAFNRPEDIDFLAEQIPYEHRLTAATMAFMIIASSRDEYQFAVNAQEQTAFNRLCDALALSEEQIDLARTDAMNELTRKLGFWEQMASRFPFMSGL